MQSMTEINNPFAGILTGPRETAPNGARTGALLSYTVEGGFAGTAAIAVVRGAQPFENDLGFGFLKGAAAATADAGVDMLLQKSFGHNIGGHDLFRPTGLEALGIGVAAACSMDPRLRVGLAATSWLVGRAQNYFSA